MMIWLLVNRKGYSGRLARVTWNVIGANNQTLFSSSVQTIMAIKSETRKVVGKWITAAASAEYSGEAVFGLLTPIITDTVSLIKPARLVYVVLSPKVGPMISMKTLGD